MKKYTKNFLALTLILSVLGIAQPRKAEAAAVLWASGWLTLGLAKPKYIAAPVGWTIFASGFVAGATGVALLCGPGGSFVGAMLVVLDANGAPSKDQMVSYLANKYSFVDNFESLNDLAMTIKNKAALQTPDQNGNIFVSLSEQEVATALSSADLSSDQLKIIATDMN